MHRCKVNVFANPFLGFLTKVLLWSNCAKKRVFSVIVCIYCCAFIRQEFGDNASQYNAKKKKQVYNAKKVTIEQKQRKKK